MSVKRTDLIKYLEANGFYLGSFGMVGKNVKSDTKFLEWVTARIKIYCLIVKIIAAPNPPYEL